MNRGVSQGAALVTALLLLLVMTIIGISGITSSTLELRMAGNTQDFYDQFQSADAGVSKAMTVASNFDGKLHEDIFNGGSNELDKKRVPYTLTVNVTPEELDLPCPRKEAATSDDVFTCKYYDIDSTYIEITDSKNIENNVKANAAQGVAKELLAR
ncbi:MAG: pilus assembly PilX N-terminal domain-containing protein [Gammaproteobacteria bacterium]|nr:pilus assembly PilX N-terminal domain-containing protein [Gammaproteobacteria bacterium]MBU1655301.1 pilus assembly PilX N-terminal domain-containing protein [Gammaproteobacteria bacterium]MBU1960771.1 pilus assembly PilX N-terminal domain-containing protein [Gammaproteobacteria bacterium]